MCHKYGQGPSDVVTYGRLQEPFGLVRVSCRHLAPHSTAQHSTASHTDDLTRLLHALCSAFYYVTRNKKCSLLFIGC